ncbi:MAG: EamA family transporter [Candidatus Kerfeldbacteria bacterium]|nr:EamA family transporter [Candidatus Kerfeldbacteria bacterium]
MWIVLTFVAALLWATTNYIDKLLLSRLHVQTGPSILILFSSVIAFFSVPLLFFFAPGIEVAMHTSTLLLASIGVLYALGLYFYFLALQYDDTSTIIPFFQLAPVITVILAYIFLHQHLGSQNIIAIIIVIVGGLLLSVDTRVGIRFRKEVVIYMLIASLCFAIGSVIFRGLATEDNFWNSWFWEQVGLAIFGIILLCIPGYRRTFVASMRSAFRSVSFLTINGVNETITLIGNGCIRFASLLAPVGIVAVLSNAIQPVIVFIFGIALTLFFPHLIKENVEKKQLLHKVCAIIIMVIGSCYLRP